jgi:hypothetical protein
MTIKYADKINAERVEGGAAKPVKKPTGKKKKGGKGKSGRRG